MATGQRFVLPNQFDVDATGTPYAGGFLYFYASGTTTPQTTYSDSGLTVPNENPVPADSSGHFGNVFLTPTATYKVTLTDAAGNQIWTADPVTSVFISPAMAPVVGAATLTAAAAAMQVPSLLVPRAQAGTAYTYQASDASLLVARSNSGTLMTDTLPGTSPGVLASRWTATILNSDATANLSIAAGSGATLTWPGGGAKCLGPGQSVQIVSDGANYYAVDPPTRAKCGAALQVYCSTAGSDTANNGLAAATPFATIDHARAVIYDAFDHNGFTPTINLAAGTYTSTQGLHCVGLPLGAPAVNILGNAASAASYIISATNGPCIAAGYGANVLATGITFTAAGSGSTYGIGGVGLIGYNGAEANWANCIFSTCSVSHISSTSGATCQSLGLPYTISGNAPYHVDANGGGNIIIGSTTVTLTGTPAFTAFAASDSSGLIFASSMTFSGSATGARYAVTSSGVIETVGGGATYFPGNSPGTNDGTGIYT